MKKQRILIAVALLALTVPACNKQKTETSGTPQPPAPPAADEAKLRAAFGFAAQVPSDSEGYVAFYQLGKLWHDFKATKTFASLLANPLVQEATGQDSFKKGWGEFSSNPDAAKWRAIVSDALGSETFVSFAPGSAVKLQAWMRISNEMRVAQIKAALAAQGNAKQKAKPDDYLVGLLPFVKTLDFPPVLIGFKIGAQKAALLAEIGRGEKNLPPMIDQAQFNVNGNLPFKSLVATVSKVLPPDKQDALKKFVSEKIADPAAADETFQSLLARHIEVAYGFIGDYFVVSVGPDHSHLKTSADFAGSLLSRPEIASVAGYADKALLSFSFSSAELIGAAQQKFELSPWLERLKAEVSAAVSPADYQKLEADLKRLDSESAKFIPQEYTPMIGVSYRDHGLRGEAFGGIKQIAGASAKPLQFSGAVTDSTLLWLDVQTSAEYQAAAYAWLEDFATTAYDTFQRLALPKLNDQQRMQFGIMQNLIVPKLTEFYNVTRNQYSKSLGQEGAFALDGGGEMPAVPMIPQPIRDGGKMLRFAVLRDVKDRALLGESWKSYFKLARDIALMIPQTAQLPGGLPEPRSETVDGVTLSYYPLPLPTGDLLPNVAVTDKTLVFTTSRAYGLALSKAVAAPSTQKPAMLDFRLNIRAASDFADLWLAIAAQNPELFFQGNQAKADDFKKAQPGVSALLHSLRSVSGMDMQVFEENGVRRTSSAIRWSDQ
jgi:hypothetical protein